MNKKELLSSIAESAGIIQRAATKVLDCFLNNIENTLQNDDKLVLVGFGSFSVTKRAARKGRNQQNGQDIDIPAKKIAKFKAGSKLNAMIN